MFFIVIVDEVARLLEIGGCSESREVKGSSQHYLHFPTVVRQLPHHDSLVEDRFIFEVEEALLESIAALLP